MEGIEMATRKENEDAVRDIFPAYILDEFIVWINKKLPPEDVYDAKKLQLWAESNGYVKEP